ncbi:unnamed protein product [Vitrella brassicaformis CCMP3155]|uniref:Protein kinase domain-containing protein n=1 Tax=Vitrella brassicaformis (strain CCMP3155) TaxID=1169540 RepID=A0A0G4F541_VITBC|nr:unnamed protein product [Vitrella brassicaformis CCMP3155]|eukprot:CEM07601.1 unnamed protein product [Vitrella brassicaformis CCMP3155]
MDATSGLGPRPLKCKAPVATSNVCTHWGESRKLRCPPPGHPARASCPRGFVGEVTERECVEVVVDEGGEGWEVFRVKQQYRPLEGDSVLGRGAFGTVAPFYDTLNDRPVAIKKLHNPCLGSLSALLSAVREIRCLQQLQASKCGSILRLLDVFVTRAERRNDDWGDGCDLAWRAMEHPLDDRDIYLVTDMMDGSLHDLLHHIRCSDGQPLSIPDVKSMACQLVEALAAMHRLGLMHRDLNILLRDDQLQVADFASCRVTSSRLYETLGRPLPEHSPVPPFCERPTDDDQAGGNVTPGDQVTTLWYRAPEVLASAMEYDEKVDMWAVGCVLAEMLGAPPLFASADPKLLPFSQLTCIANLIGPPTSADLRYYAQNVSCDHDAALDWFERHCVSPAKPQMALHEVLPADADPQAVDLVRRCLTYNPHDRISSSEALRHPFFADVPETSRNGNEVRCLLQTSPGLNLESFVFELTLAPGCTDPLPDLEKAYLLKRV